MSSQPTPQVYHRLGNESSQTFAIGQLQQISGRILGKAANYGSKPCVKAYIGILPIGASGIEFTTIVPHAPRFSTPWRANWFYPATPGVGLIRISQDDYAWIPATVIKVVA